MIAPKISPPPHPMFLDLREVLDGYLASIERSLAQIEAMAAEFDQPAQESRECP